MRWPNDVVVDGRKLAGILAEVRDGARRRRHRRERRPRGRATCPPTPASRRRRCGSCSGGPVDRAALLADVLEAIEAGYRAFERDGFSGLERDDLRGRRVSLAGGDEGICDGVDDAGRLVVAGVAHTADEVVAVDVSL